MRIIVVDVREVRCDFSTRDIALTFMPISGVLPEADEDIALRLSDDVVERSARSG